MRILFSICFYLIFQTTYSQEWYNDSQTYHGTAIMADRSSIRGEFSYNQKKETLSFENGKKVKASEALYFQYYDSKEKYNRYFFSLISRKGKFAFYEALLNGKILLYRKLISTKKDFIDSKNTQTTLHINKATIEDRLFINQNDTIIAITNFEQQILPLLKDQIKAISNYILSKELDLTISSNQILVIDHYNGLFNE